VAAVVMIRTPLRVSFAGGGSDRPEFIEARGAGRVVSTTITRYVHVTAHRRLVQSTVRVAYTRTEEAPSAAAIDHDIVREALLTTGLESAIEVHTIAELPSRGSGLGASSALAVGCLHAFRALQGERPTAAELARQACDLEIERLGQRIGRQDQWACALGGVREYAFLRGGEVRSYSLRLGREARAALEAHLLLVWSPRRGDTSARMLAEQTDLDAIEALAGFVPATTEALLAGNMRGLGNLLRASWEIKRRLAEDLSPPDVDAMIDAALGTGAYGAKLCGAGGGGCILLITPPERREAVVAAMAPGITVPAGLDFKGTVVCYAQGRDHPGP